MKPFALITAITATAALLAVPVLAASDPPKLNIGGNYLKCTNMRENLVKCGISCHLPSLALSLSILQGIR